MHCGSCTQAGGNAYQNYASNNQQPRNLAALNANSDVPPEIAALRQALAQNGGNQQ